MKNQAPGLQRPCSLPITHLPTTHSPRKNWRLAWLWPHRLLCIPHAQMPPLLQGTQPPSLFWTTAHFHHSLEFKVEDWGRPMLFTYQSLKNYRVKIASFSCDPGFSASVAHILCAGQEKSWREFLWRTDKVKVRYNHLWTLIGAAAMENSMEAPQKMKKRATIWSSNPTPVHIST